MQSQEILNSVARTVYAKVKAFMKSQWRWKLVQCCVFTLVLVATVGSVALTGDAGDLQRAETSDAGPSKETNAILVSNSASKSKPTDNATPSTVSMTTTAQTNAAERMREKQRSQQEIADCLTNGAWIQQDYTKEQAEQMRIFVRKTRDQYNMPEPLQRKDLKCGKVTLGGGGLNWFRGVCDPYNTTPCCYNGMCQNKTEEECRCEGCVDMRQTTYAEYSEWKNKNPSCQVQKFDRNQACEVVNASRIVFIGDSHMRHMYMGMQILLTGNDETGCLAPDTPEDVQRKCRGLYMFTEKVCGKRVMSTHPVCGGHVVIELKELYSSAYADRIMRVVSDHVGKPGSVVVIGLGHHDSFEPLTIIPKVAEPVVRLIEQSGSPWPKLIWVGAHSMGLLKTPTVPKQTNPFVVKLNARLSDFWERRQVTFLNPFNLTKGVASPDGSHYGRGANLLKARVLVDFIRRVGYTDNIADHFITTHTT